MHCAHCDADNPPGARFCGACGASLEAACPHCGAALLAGLRFCTGCGHDLAGPAKTPADDEPLPMSDFIVVRGLALARFGRGVRGADLQASLVGRRDLAAHAELNAARPTIESALTGFGSLPPMAPQSH